MSMQPREIIVDVRMQRGYRYLQTKPAGCCFHSDFRPLLTPKQMLDPGVFGGKSMTDYCKQGDIMCSPVQRQVPLHWAYDSRRT